MGPGAGGGFMGFPTARPFLTTNFVMPDDPSVADYGMYSGGPSAAAYDDVTGGAYAASQNPADVADNGAVYNTTTGSGTAGGPAVNAAASAGAGIQGSVYVPPAWAGVGVATNLGGNFGFNAGLNANAGLLANASLGAAAGGTISAGGPISGTGFISSGPAASGILAPAGANVAGAPASGANAWLLPALVVAVVGFVLLRK